MKDFINIIDHYEKHTATSDASRLAIGTIIGIEGNSFRRTGIRILIHEDGQWFCGEEKGVFDGYILQQVQYAIKHNKAIVEDVNTAHSEGHAIGINLGYRGVLQFFIHPINEQGEKHPISILKASLSEMNHRILMTITRSVDRDDINAGDLYLYQNKTQLSQNFSDTELIQFLDQCAQECWEKGRSALRTINLGESSIEVFYEILTHPPQLVIFGRQYDVYPLVSIAKSIGWRVKIVANPEKIRTSLVKNVDEVIALEDAHLLQPDAYTAYILMSHIFERDMQHLVAATKTDVPYIGMLGPSRRFKRMFAQLADQGFLLNEDDKKRLHAPMGLDIGGATQEEIAIALIAEVRAFFSQRKGGFLKNLKGRIHDR